MLSPHFLCEYAVFVFLSHREIAPFINAKNAPCRLKWKCVKLNAAAWRCDGGGLARVAPLVFSQKSFSPPCLTRRVNAVFAVYTRRLSQKKRVKIICILCLQCVLENDILIGSQAGIAPATKTKNQNKEHHHENHTDSLKHC